MSFKAPVLTNEAEHLLDQIGVSRETVNAQRQYIGELLRWQAKTNLVSPSTIEHIWSRHIVDSLQLVPMLDVIQKNLDITTNTEIQTVDIGSGGGLPILPLALAKEELPNIRFAAIESNHKKSSFLRQTARACGCSGRLSVYSERIEVALLEIFKAAEKDTPKPMVITARALADLSAILTWSKPIFDLQPKLKLLLHKGREYRAEIDESHTHWCFDLVEHQSIVDSESRIIEISNLRQVEY